MKKIFAYTFIVLAALVASTTAMNAQTPGTGPEGVVFNKTVTKNNANSYTINIETYVTGQVTEIVSEYHTPVDVIFVLDFSSSMGKTMDGKTAGRNDKTRLDALKEGVKAALEILRDDPKLKDGTYHRAGLIRFCNETNNDRNKRSRVISELTDVNDSYNTDILSSEAAGNDTKIEEGTSRALSMAAGRTGDDSKRPLVVIIFTDGAPETVTGTNKAIMDKYNLIHTHKAKVYTIATAADVKDPKMLHYLNVLSSNYPDINTASFKRGSGQIDQWEIDDSDIKTTPDPNKYYKSVNSVSELVEIFSEITQEATNSGNAAYDKLTSASAANIDIVSENFKLPNALLSASNPADYIHVKVSQVKGIDNAGNFTWDEPVVASTVGIELIDSTPDDGKDVKDGVKITGFDYSGNFVSEIKDAEGHSYNPKRVNKGYKLIINFDIEINPENPGGANEVTNDIKSGLYVDGEQIACFQQPTVNNPNILIVKKGLRRNESAVFTIHDLSGAMADMKVVATCTADGEDAFVLIKVQNDGRYIVTEDTWSWAYGTPELSYTKANGNDATSGSSITRDVNASTEDSTTFAGKKGTTFIFTNTLNTTLQHGEGYKNNVFSGHSEPSNSSTNN